MSDAATPAQPNCPFYGCHLFMCFDLSAPKELRSLKFIQHRNNQCALVLYDAWLCLFMPPGPPADWRLCGRVKDLQIDLPGVQECPR
jgi:hypothetical protein